MNILIYDWKNYGIEDLCDTFTKMGHTYQLISEEKIRDRKSAEFDSAFEQTVTTNNYDCVFTFNFYPIISNNCNKYNIPYISYIYDSPQVALYSCAVINSCNYIFIFDKSVYLELKNSGIPTVYYMPLSVNTDRLNQMFSKPLTSEQLEKYSSDIAFVGSMYNEKHNLFDRLKNLKPYTEGYLHAIMDAQLKVYGYYFIEEVLTESVVADMQNSVPVEPNSDGVETPKYIYAHYFIARKLANMERTQIFKKISEDSVLKNKNVKLFTPNPTPEFTSIQNMGPIDYYDEMPYIFKNSKINLNISLRSILSGIPLRGMDIMGAGGFLLSNYQEDFLDYFVPGEDFVYYESQEDLIEKCHYYLSHENERKQIAQNAAGKIAENHTYEKHLTEMFEIVFS